MWISGISEKAEKAMELANKIVDEAIMTSSLRNKVLKFTQSDFPIRDILSGMKIVEVPLMDINNIFIPENKKEQVNRFIYSINNYHNDKDSLRFLFNGKPGTGKTQLINSIINLTLGKVTVILCNGGNLPINQIIGFCEYFSPCLLIIDDLDFIAGDRKNNCNNAALGDFLQALDGFLPKNVFLLGATNDKTLVDKAASRPGRFDLIIDISEIHPKNYLSLVQRETKNDKIISFFNETTLEDLRRKKVSGAFIVSLVKQLESAIRMKGTITGDDFKEYFDLSHKGFYSFNDDSLITNVGFNK
jgi:SpoVK/Ycf46/Vps4 family AAA+-type ATPase